MIVFQYNTPARTFRNRPIRPVGSPFRQNYDSYGRLRLAVELLLDELDRGEAETIVLAHELNVAWALMDEKEGWCKLADYELIRTDGKMETGAVSDVRGELWQKSQPHK
jgi:hypothetical protein